MTIIARPLIAVALCAAWAGTTPPAHAAPEAPPPILAPVDVVEALGIQLPGGLSFQDGDGRLVHLSELYSSDRPILLSLAYYRCPMLCGLVLRSVAQIVATLGWKPGKELRIVTISFDPTDGPQEARARQATVLAGIGRTAETTDWPFWTGDATNVNALLTALGVRTSKDPATGQIAHPAVFFVLTPGGRVSRYLYGLDVSTFQTRLALIEASGGKIGSTLEHVILRCYAWDPATRRYGAVIQTVLRTGGAVILLAVGGLLGVLLRRNHLERRRAEGEDP